MKVRIMPTLKAGDRYLFAGIPEPVGFQNAPEVTRCLKEILMDWPLTRITGLKAAARPNITVRRSAAGFTRTSRWLDGPKTYPSAINATCDLLVDVFHAYVAAHPDRLCLHTAAVRTRAGVVLLASPYRGGKSTFAVRLMAAGYPLFADDVMPVMADPQTGQEAGLSFGIMPRLRRPWPTEGDAAFEAFIESRRAAESGRFTYLRPKPEERSPHGMTAPVAGVVFLNRQDSGPASIRSVGAADAVEELMLRNFAHHEQEPDIAARLSRMVDGIPSLTLSYGRAADGVTMFSREFPCPE